MKQIQCISVLVLLLGSTLAVAEEAYYFVWSTCVDCCESGEGEHLYISNVILADDSDWDQIEGPFINQVKNDYPNSPRGATVSAGYESESEANRARQKLAGGMRSYAQVHDIEW